MTPRRIVFWEPSLSPHKLPLFRALAARGFDMTYVAQEGLAADRIAQGWTLGPTNGLDIRIAPDRAAIEALVREFRNETLHLFSGIRWRPVLKDGIAAALRHEAAFALMSEPRASEGWRGMVRLLHSWATEAKVRRHARFVLAIGRHGPAWFRQAGYPSTRIFPFAYYVDAPPALPRPAGPTTIGYLGRLERAKGIDLFLDAAARLDPAWRVVVAGHGDEEHAVRTAPRVEYVGALPMAEAPAFLAGLDVLVQPSRTTDDGWGAVIGEALLAGAAAVASDRTGASILLDDSTRGRVAHTLSPTAIADAIRDAAADAHDPSARARRAAWARTCLTGEAGAERVVAILDHLAGNAPAPPFPPS